MMRRQRFTFLAIFLVATTISFVHAEDATPPVAVAPFSTDAAGQHQKKWAEHRKAPVESTNSLGMKLRLIPAGEFTMGSPETEKNRDEDEVPHMVRILQPFYIGMHEVTQKEWRKVMETEPWKGKSYSREGDNYPAIHVTWDDANRFCFALSEKEGKKYRLPTEAEWEFACRAGSSTAYSFGDDEKKLPTAAWFDMNVGEAGDKFSHPVGAKQANPFGLHDMHGNVWEWCADWMDEKYYTKSPKVDPKGPTEGEKRVYRGGGWIHPAVKCRSASRSGFLPIFKSNSLGFRVVQVLGDK